MGTKKGLLSGSDIGRKGLCSVDSISGAGNDGAQHLGLFLRNCRDIFTQNRQGRRIGLVGMDDEVDFRVQAVDGCMDAGFGRGTDVADEGEIVRADRNDVFGTDAVIALAGWGDGEFLIGNPGADISPGPGHQAFFHQFQTGFDDFFSCS